jgi:predicted nucleotidyltransferase
MANQENTELTNDFVSRMRATAGDNVLSVILYGSAAEGEFHPEYSDLNLLCVVRDVSFPALAKISNVVEWWRGKKHHPPLVLSVEELNASAGVFSIEFVDMKSRYRVLFGEDVLQNLQVPLGAHLFQLRYELREKLTLLRQHMLLAARREKQLWEAMLHSVSSFTTLFRHVLLEMGEQGRKHSRDAVAELAARMNFDPAPFVQLMDVRAGKLDRKQISASDLVARYLAAIEKVAMAVDTMRSTAA